MGALPAGTSVSASKAEEPNHPVPLKTNPVGLADTRHVRPAAMVATGEPSGWLMVTGVVPPRVAEGAPTMRPTLISVSRELGEGESEGCLTVTPPEVQLRKPVTARTAERGRGVTSLTSVIPKLQLDAEILSLQERDDRL